MQRITLEDLQKAMKLLNLEISEERLLLVAPALNLTMDAIRLPSQVKLAKELEPITYLTELKKIGRR
jgi:hypothetical protein